MWNLIISILAFIIIMFIINLIDKNKERLIEKFKIEKKEVMKCPHCFREYEDLELKECTICNFYLEQKTKYILPKKLKKKIICITLGIVAVILIGTGLYLGITNYIKEQQRIEKYNNDLSTCYEVIKNNLDFEKFTSIIAEHKEETDFSSEAYKKLYQAIDERIENIKNGNEDDKLSIWLYNIQYDSLEMQNKFEERYLKAKTYTSINEVNKNIEAQKYKDAYDLLITIVTNNKDKNQDIVELATNKQNEIKEKAFEQVITQAQEKINNKEYESAQTLLGKYKDFGNQTIVDMYNNATNEVNRIETEKKAQEELERRKKQEEERKRQQAELDAKKDKIIVDTNGKRIYKVCMASNTFRLSGTFKGQGHFSVELLDSNQDLYKLMVNEIGDYIVNKSVSVTKGAYYYLQIECTRGSWELNWSGTYGD